MFTITIAREFGSGGLKIADRVARQIDVPCLEREIVRLAAEGLGITERTAEKFDETRPSLIAHMLELMGKYGEHGSYAELGAFPSLSVPPPYQPPIDSDAFREATERAIRSIAEHISAVVVGRAGQMILKDYPHVLHVCIVADFADRVERTIQREGLDRRAAEKRVRNKDARQSAFMKGYYKVDWRDPRLYDVMLNSSLLGVEGCVSTIVEALTRKGWTAASPVAAWNGAGTVSLSRLGSPVFGESLEDLHKEV